MQPKTKVQKEVFALSEQLPPLTKKQNEYAYHHCHDKIGFMSAGEIWCIHCGRINGQPDPLAELNDGDTYICPFCGAKTKIQRKRKRIYNEAQYYTIITTIKGWQVIRHFMPHWSVGKGTYPTFTCPEAVQIWVREDGTEVIVARPILNYMWGSSDTWDFERPMEIRRRQYSYGYYTGDKYNIWANTIYPRTSVLPILRRNGFCLKAANNAMPPCRLAISLLKDPEAEYLVKTHQYSLLHYFKFKRNVSIKDYLPSVKVALRHGYKIADAGMWVDYLDLLEYFHLDKHNPHYICPLNLKAEHDRMVERKRVAEARRRDEEHKAEALKWEETYREQKGAYFGICFGNEHICVTVIQSVMEMREEGNAMHHCVFANEYYKRPDCLILSAKDKEGRRVETIEVDLKTFNIVQSRGVCNQNTEYHDEILKLIRANMDKIMSVRNAA